MTRQTPWRYGTSGLSLSIETIAMSDCSKTPHKHFIDRVNERIGNVDPAWLWERIIISIRYEDGWARFKAKRHYRDSKRYIYYFHHEGERHFVLVQLDLPKITPITILPRSAMIRGKSSKRPKHLQNGKYSANRSKTRKQKERRR